MAANTIGSISIDVLANIANMVSDLGKVTSENGRATKEMQRQWQEAGETIKGTLESVAAMLGIGLGVGELAKLGIEAIETAEKIDKLKASLGASTETLQTLQYVAATTGSNLDDASGAFIKLERSAAQAAAGSAQQIEAFRALGISATQVKDLMKDPDELIRVTTQHLAELADGTTKTAIILELFGRGAAQNTKLFNELGEGFQKATDQARVFGLVLSDHDNKALLEANEALDAIGARMLGLGNQIGVTLAPAIEKVSELFVSSLNSEQFRTGLETVGKTVLIVAENLGTLASALTMITEFKIAQWAIQGAAAVASLATEAAIGASVWAEMTGSLALVEVGMAGVTAAGSALLAVVGGIPGVIALLAVGVYELSTHQDNAAKTADTLRQAENLLSGVTGDNVQNNLALAGSLQTAAEKTLALAKADLARLEAEAALENQHGGGGFGEDAALTAASYAQVNSEIEQLRGTIDAEQKSLDDQHQRIQVAANDMRQFSAAITEVSRSFVAGDTAGNFSKFVDGSNQIHAAAARMIADGADATIVHAQEEQAIGRLSVALDGAGKSQGTYNAKVDATKATADESGDAMLKFAAMVDQLNGRFGNPYQKAISDYNAGIKKLELGAIAAAVAGADVTQVIALWQQGETALGLALVDTTKKLDDAADILGKFQREASEEAALVGLTGRNLAVAEAVKKVTDEYNKNVEAGKPVAGTLESIQKGAAATEGSLYDLSEAAKQNQQAMNDWVGIWKTAGDSIANGLGKAIVEGESLMDDLKDVAKQVVEAIIAQFAKLAIINPILNSIFGINANNGSLLPTLGSLAGGAFTGAGTAGAGVNFASTASGSTGTSLLNNGVGWISAGTKLWQGFQAGGFSGAIGNLFGFGSTAASLAAGNTLSAGVSAGWAGGTGLFGSGVGAATGASSGVATGASALSAFASWIPIIGLIIAGMAEDNKLFKQGWKASNGMDWSSVGSNPIAGALAPGAFVVTMDDKMLRSLGFGEQFASILTGSSVVSRLFGHQAPKLVNGTMTQEFGPDGIGGGIDANIRSKGGFFSSDKNWTEHSDLDADTLKAMQEFFDSIKKASDSYAKFLGLDEGTVASGTFAQQFDKNGKPTGKTTSTLGGHTFQDETQAQFDERLQAQNFVDDLKLAGVDVTTFTDSMIDDADKWSAAVQDVAQAMANAKEDLKNGVDVGGKGTLQGDFDTVQTYDTDSESQTDTYGRLSQEMQDLKNGIGLVTGQDTIADIEAFLGVSQKFGETLSQTYMRLEQAGQQYTQFMAQFKTATYVDDYEAAMAGIKKAYIDNVKQANDLAKAAGLSGASVEDLANIMAATAQQEAAALKQLEGAAQSLAFSLGITTVGSLDDVNSEIAALQSQAGQGASAIGSFGSAMQTAAQKASEAMDLLLGDDSPFNDKAKLQYALQGLYAGTVSKEQVLDIGKRLWTTSSSEYQALFSQVMAAPSHGEGTVGGGGGGSGQHGLTGDQQQRLSDLLKEQQTLQAVATQQQFQTLAQQVAEIASSKGEDWKQVLQGMGVDIDAFEKGLGKTDAQTDAYIKAAQDQKDSDGDNTASIVYWLKVIAEQGGADVNVTVQLPPAGGGHSGHARPNLGGNPSYQHGRGGQPARTITVVGG